MKVYYEPSFSTENTYVQNVINGLKSNGCEIYNEAVRGKKNKLISYIKFLFSEDVKIYHINWVENIVTQDDFKSKIKVGIWLTFVKICHMRKKKVVWTMHNTVPHGCKNEDYAARFYKKWANAVDMIVVHANESAEILKNKYGVNDTRICVVPHGGYHVDQISDEEIAKRKKKYNIIENNFVFLYFGQIDDYKNIPLLINTFETLQISNAVLLVCGSLSHRLSRENREWLERYRGKDNIILDFRFVPESEISAIFQMSDVVVLPYEKRSMQNSGVAILSICEGKPIIIPKFGYIKDISNQPFVFSYDYENEVEHKAALKNTILEVYNSIDKAALSRLSEKEKIYADQNLNWDNITKNISERYRALLGEEKSWTKDSNS